MEENIGPKDRERIAKVEASEAGQQMIRRKGKKASTKLIYVRGALLFSEFLSKNLDDIVNEYKADIEANLVKAWDKWEEVFTDFGDYLTEKYGGGTTAKTYFEGAKALINSNVSRSALIKPESPTGASRTIAPITMEDLRILRGAADSRERAFIDILKDSGISRDDVVELTYKDVKRAIEDPTITVYKINVYRRKENVEYETWIGNNAIESLRAYFMIRRQRGEQITDNTPIFASEFEPYEALTPRSLSALFRRLWKRTGITVSTHRLRKTFETYITAGGAHPIVAKYWMGHKIKTGRDVEAHYIIPPENLQRDIYVKAYAYIDVVPKYLEKERLKAIEDLKKALSPEQLETLKSTGVVRFMKRQFKEVPFIHPKRRRRHRTAHNGGCDDGEHCGDFKQINESALLEHLQVGWIIVHKLQSGEVIVRRN